MTIIMNMIIMMINKIFLVSQIPPVRFRSSLPPVAKACPAGAGLATLPPCAADPWSGSRTGHARLA